MKLEPKDSLSKQDIQNGLNQVIKDGLASQTMLTLTAGVFLIAFALQMGASNIMIGFLAAIPPLTQLVQLPSVMLIEKFRTRKKIAVFSAMASRMFLLVMVAIPFFFSHKIGLIVLIGTLLLHAILNAILVCSWNSWMRDLVPENQLGSFFSKRLSLATIPAILLSIAAGIFIDFWEKHSPAQTIYCYSLLFFLGFLAGMIGIYFISTIPEPKMVAVEEKRNFIQLIKQPFKDENYKNLLIFLCSWNFAISLAGPYFAVYLIKRLEFGMGMVMGFTVLGQVSYLIFLRIWGILSDRFSNKSVLSVSGFLNILCILAWTFTTMPEKYILTIPLLVVIHIFLGISTAGVTLASGNIGLKLAPKGQATSYLAATSILNSLAAGIAPIIGGVFADFFMRREISWIFRWISPQNELMFQTLNLRGLDFFFFFAFLIGLYSIHRLAAVREVGEVREKIIINEFIALATRRARSLTTVGGLRYISQMPFTIALKNKRKRKKKISPDEAKKRNH